MTGEANANAKGTKLRHKMWLYPNYNSGVLQFKQDTALVWKKRLCVLTAREEGALLMKQIEGLCAVPPATCCSRGGVEEIPLGRPYSYSWLETKS